MVLGSATKGMTAKQQPLKFRCIGPETKEWTKDLATCKVCGTNIKHAALACARQESVVVCTQFLGKSQLQWAQSTPLPRRSLAACPKRTFGMFIVFAARAICFFSCVFGLHMFALNLYLELKHVFLIGDWLCCFVGNPRPLS